MSDSLASVVTLMTEAPPRVEYELTPSALALRSVFEEIMRWADEHAGALNLIADEAKQSDKQVASAAAQVRCVPDSKARI